MGPTWTTAGRTVLTSLLAFDVLLLQALPLFLLALRVVVSRRPARIELHVDLPLLPGQLVVLGLFFAAEAVPL